mgnify:CR=1 FL=1
MFKVSIIEKLIKIPTIRKVNRLLQNLSKDIKINNINFIRDYLIEFPDIIDVIPKAVNSAKKYLPNAQIVLDFYIDPEIDDNHPIIYVRVENYDNNFIELFALSSNYLGPPRQKGPNLLTTFSHFP